jgi:hypothetical protein
VVWGYPIKNTSNSNSSEYLEYLSKLKATEICENKVNNKAKKYGYSIYDVSQEFCKRGINKHWLYTVIAECGFDCANKNNNLFGFTHSRGVIKFKSYIDCIDFFEEWLNKYPPYPNETVLQYKKRRKYNTEKPNYYQYIIKVKQTGKYHEFVNGLSCNCN